MTAFLDFHPRLQAALADLMPRGFQLRPVQEEAAEAIFAGDHSLILAPTAGGKTEAAIFPVLSELLREPTLVAGEPAVGVLYVSPLRALINNQEPRLARYAEAVGLSAFKWHGDVGAAERNRFKRNPAEILLTTPESLEVMLMSASMPVRSTFSALRYVIVDEIHAFAACDRGGHLLALLERLRAVGAPDFQRIGLSATIGNPNDLLAWLAGASTRGRRIVDPPRATDAPGPTVAFDFCEDERELVRIAADHARGKKSLLFCNSRQLAESLAHQLHRGLDLRLLPDPLAIEEDELVLPTEGSVRVHHGSIAREEREEAEAFLAASRTGCLVCTSTMELGLDVGDLDQVLQVDAPGTVSSFRQRLGRSGRRGGGSRMVFLATGDDALLLGTALVELALRRWVEPVELSGRAWHLLLHQIMTTTLQAGGLPRYRIWAILRSASPFRDISEAEFGTLVDHLVGTDMLLEVGGVLVPGDAAEQDFGRRNWMSLYATFSTPLAFTVVAGGKEIGELDRAFTEHLVVGGSIVLAGRGWVVEEIRWEKRVVVVRNAPVGMIPTWSSFQPHIRSREVCEQIRELWAGTSQPSYLGRRAVRRLEVLQADFGVSLRQRKRPLERSDRALRWWTFAGLRINRTIARVLEAETGVKVRTDNFWVQLQAPEGQSLDGAAIVESLQRACLASTWSNPDYVTHIAQGLPPTGDGKFDRYLPAAFVRERRLANQLDVAGTIAFLQADVLPLAAGLPAILDA
ncbi:MAG: box helicase [Cyanobacteria bacterium RYN_339]|nr:box helicase [Cyanobacteria bacterium RYN_339]